MAAEVTATIKITIVFDNYPYSPKLKTGFGFACVLETGERKILFDTGSEGDILLNNMMEVNLMPQSIDAVVLSHNHWDHTGGLNDFLTENNDVDVHLPVSFPGNFKADVKRSGARLIEVSESSMLSKGIYSTGEIQGIMHEQSIICRTDDGSVVITGCAHPGIAKILLKAKTLHGPVHMAMGGFHLRDEKLSSLQRIVETFKELRINKVCPSHCTGDNARSLFQKIYGQDCIMGGVGSTFNFA